MISQFLTCLENNGLLSYKNISSFNNSPCEDSNVEIIDFNKVATDFYQKHGGTKPSTVNGIIIDDNDIPYFLEMNQYYAAIDTFEQRFLSASISDSTTKKINGTNKALSDIQEKLNCTEGGYTPNVKTIILTEISDYDYSRLRLMNFDRFNIAQSDEIGILNCEQFEAMFG